MSTSEVTSIGAYDAKTHFSELLEKVEAGAEFTITRHGKPVARLVPVNKQSSPEERSAAIARWIESSRGLSLGGLTFRELASEGRR